MTYSNGAALGAFAGFMWSMTQVGALASPVLGFGAGAGTPPGWSAQHGLSGKAAATWTLRFDTKAKLYQKGVPAPMWTVRGILAYDPRKDSTYPGGNGPHRMADPADTAAYDAATATWEWTEDPYLLGLRWAHGFWQRDPRDPNSKYQRVMGIGAPWGAIDVASFVEGANVSQANGWTCGGVVYSGDGKWDTMKKILQAGMGEPVALGARISCFVNAPKVSLASITIDDVVGPASVAATQPRRDRINTITPSFRLEANNWQHLPGAPIGVAAHIAEDGGKRARGQDYWFIQNTKQVGTAVRYDIENAREFGPITLPVKLHWMGYKPGDCVTAVLPELGLNGQPILLLNRTLGAASGIVTLSARSETNAKHAFALGQTATPPPTPGVSGPPIVPVPAEAAWAITANSLISAEQTVPALVITGSVDAGTADAVVFEYRPFVSGQASEAGWASGGTWAVGTVRAEITSVRSGTAYEAAISYQRNGVTGGRRIIGPVVTAGPTIDFDGVTGPNRPEPGATVGAPPGTKVGDRPVEEVIATLERIDPIEAKVDAQALVAAAQERALATLTGVTNEGFADLDRAGANRDQALRDIDRQLDSVAKSVISQLIELDTMRGIIRDAGITVDPEGGKVRFWAIENLTDDQRRLEVTLDAQAGEIRSKVTVNQVHEMITLAAFDPSQIADLTTFFQRITTVEQVQSGILGQLTQKAEAIDLMAQALKVSTVSTKLDALAGVVESKASLTQVEDQEVRLTDLAQRFAATPDGARMDIELRQVRAISSANQLDVLKGILAGDEAEARRVAEIAEYRQDAVVRIDAGLAAQSLATRTLSSAMGAIDSRLTDRVNALVTTTGGQAERIGALQVSSDKQTAQIASLERAAIDATGGIAGVTTTVRQMLPVQKAANLALLDQVVAGDEAAAKTTQQLAQAQVDMTTRFVAGELSQARLQQLLETRIAGNAALIGQTLEAQALVNQSTASRIDAVSVSFGKLSGDLATATDKLQGGIDGLSLTTANLTRDVGGLANTLGATARDLATLSAEMRDPSTGLPATRALALSVQEASAAAAAANLKRIEAAEAAVSDAKTGLDAVRTALASEVELSARERAAQARALDSLTAQVIDPATNKPMWEGSIGELRRIVLEGDQKLAEDVKTVSTTVNGHTSSISFLMRSIDGEDAVAQLSINAAGKVTGFRVNGKESLFAIAADRFIIGDSQIFEVDTVTGKVRMNDVEVKRIAAGVVDTDNIVGNAVSDTLAADFTGNSANGALNAYVTIASLAVTTTKSTDRVLLMLSGVLNANVEVTSGTVTNTRLNLRLQRADGTIIRAPYTALQEDNSGAYGAITLIDLDVPGTAGTYTYQLQGSVAKSGGSGTQGANVRAMDGTFVATILKR